MTGKNDERLNEQKFIAGMQRYGVDNPLPTVTKRLALYGNSTDVDKMVEEAIQRLRIKNGVRMNPNVFSTAKLRGPELTGAQKQETNNFDLKETKELQPVGLSKKKPL